MTCWLHVVVATPAHSAVAGPLTYRSELPLAPGTLVRVPLGKREVLGVVWGNAADSGDLLEMQTKSIASVLDGLAPPLTCVAGNGGVRSLGESRRAPVPSGGYGQGADRTGELCEPLFDVSLCVSLA